jgi:hypothetical protein
VLLPATPRRDAGDDLRAIFDALLGMERSLVARNTLTNNLAVFVNQYTH